jgi:hypothetical protein
MSTTMRKEEIDSLLNEQAISEVNATISELETVHETAQAKIDEAIVIDFKMFEDEANAMKKVADRFSVT